MSQMPIEVGQNRAPLKEMPLYDQDFYQWTLKQSQALRERNVEALDWDNLTLEIESLGKEQLHAVESYLKQLIAHQFKLQYVDDEYCRLGWQKEINTFKDGIEDRLTNSLKNKIDLEKVYRRAKRDVLTDYPELKGELPENCPYSLDDLLN
ncbi:MAG: DUF29 domain-containing protein [Microcystaceae cyanobacterium]